MHALSSGGAEKGGHGGGRGGGRGHHASALLSLPAGDVSEYDARATFICIYNVDLSGIEAGTQISGVLHRSASKYGTIFVFFAPTQRHRICCICMCRS